MEEQSHKEEMRAALRGDFERLRVRLGGEADAPRVAEGPTSVEPVTTSPIAAELAPAASEQRGSRAARLFGRR